MIGNPRLWIEITVNVTGIVIGIKVNVTRIRIEIGIIEFAKHWNRIWNRSHMTLESESESKFLGNTGIGIRIGITCYWNRNHEFWKTLESESEYTLYGIRIGVGITGLGIIYNSVAYYSKIDNFVFQREIKNAIEKVLSSKNRNMPVSLSQFLPMPAAYL